MKNVLLFLVLSVPAFGQILGPILGGNNAGGGGGGGTVSFVAKSSCPGTSSGAACTITTTSSGHGLFVLLATNALTSFTAVTDGGDTFTQVPSASAQCDGETIDIWYTPNTGGARTSITVTDAAGQTYIAAVYEVSGTNTSSPLDQHTTNSGSGSNPTGPSITTTAASELVIAQMAVNTSLSAVAAPFTPIDYTLNGNGWAHTITTSTGTYNPSWTGGSGSYCGTIASFKP